MRITSKLGVLVAVPLVAVLVFAALAVSITGGAAGQAEDLRRLVATGSAAGELVHQLQRERAAAVLVLTGVASERDAFLDQAATTDQAAQEYQQARAQLPALPAGTAALVERIDGQLIRLAGLRLEIGAGTGRASAVTFSYRIVIATLITLRESVAQAGQAPPEVADQLRAGSALSQATEAVGLLQVAVVRANAHGPLSQAAQQEVSSARAAFVRASQDFDTFATIQWRSALELAATGEEALVAQELEDQVARASPGTTVAVDPVEWTQAMASRMARQRDVESVVDADILSDVTALRDAQRRLAGLQIAAVVLAVLGAVALAVLLGRPVVAGLRRLRDAAHRVAHHVLPSAVAQLEAQEELGGLTPEQFADQVPSPVQVRGRDELAEVGAAFNAVHREAVRTAAGQAMLRMRIGEMFVNLARRGQTLAGELTAAMDDIERDEADPRRLTKLFDVDHLVTLLGRANDSLLVLGGAASAQVRTSNEPLAGVLRAAEARVRQYRRIEVGVVDEGVDLLAPVVDDTVLLLAELMDNATRFSNPDSLVLVSARWLGDRVVVQVVDEGVGIHPERRDDFNRRLATRPPLDLQAVRSMGLTVVSRLAERHGIRVELRPAHPRGTLAEVTLPPGLVAIGRDGRRQAVARAASAVPAVVGRAPSRPGPGLSWPPADPLGAGIDSPTQQIPLQIYDQVRRSLWFTPVREDPADAVPVGTGKQPSPTWQTRADAAWEAAARSAEPVPAGVTVSGLPVRRRGAQLVPGGVEPTSALALTGGATGDGAGPAGPGVPDPARVSAAAAAFSRGLATGRSAPARSAQPSSTQGSTPNGDPTS